MACMGPQWESHHFPSCTIPLPTASERVVIIPAAPDGVLSKYHVGGPNSATHRSFISITENDHQNYIVLGPSSQTIWEFSGDIDSISGLVVMGSPRFGPHAAGVVGVPEDKIIWTDPDLSLLDNVLRTSCTRITRACTPSQWFGEGPDKRASFHPPVENANLPFDAVIQHNFLDPDPDEPITLVFPKDATAIDPTKVISRNPVQPYGLLPGQPGLDALVAEGALIAINRRTDHPLIQDYNVTFSEVYRSRFDPDFSFTPAVDYIITRAVTLPSELPPTAFMTAPGAPAPDMNGNRPYHVCYFKSEVAKPEGKYASHDSPLCRDQPKSRAISDADGLVLEAAGRFDRAPFGNPSCAITNLSEDTHVAVLALHDGNIRRYRDDPPGQIDIHVTREDPVALYVAMNNSRVHWNITGDQVTHIFTDRTQLTTATLNGIPIDVAGLHNKADGCPNFAPYWGDNLGPAIAHLDALFVDLTGQPINKVITGAGWNSLNGPPLTFEID